MTSLHGQVAAVTGGARGIGDAIAARLAQDGARVFALDKLSPEEPREGVTYVETDVTSPDSVATAFRAIDSEAGQIDILGGRLSARGLDGGSRADA
jgi:NAD(P)-dependent dehydrogenase (short-subunit alcohol dehydrogenase family)